MWHVEDGLYESEFFCGVYSEYFDVEFILLLGDGVVVLMVGDVEVGGLGGEGLLEDDGFWHS